MRNFIDLMESVEPPYPHAEVADMSLWRGASQEDMVNEASSYDRGMGATGFKQACRPASDYYWAFDHNYPLNKVEDGYAEMIIDDMHAWDEDGSEDRYDDLFFEPLRDPIIVVEIGGVGYILDGCHRTGAFILMGSPTIPAIVGHPKP